MLGTNYKRKQQALDHLEALLSVLKTEDASWLGQVTGISAPHVMPQWRWPHAGKRIVHLNAHASTAM
jgi:hypothetical protein